MKTKILSIIIIIACGAFLPLFGQDKDQRTVPIKVNLIIEDSAALSAVLNDVGTQPSNSLVNGILQNGDHLTVWTAGKTAQILFNDTLKTQDDKTRISNILKNLPVKGDYADFSTALNNAASQKTGQNIQYTMLVSASRTTLSPANLGSSAQLMKYSKVENYSGWQALIIAPGINEQVRQAAAAYYSAKH